MPGPGFHRARRRLLPLFMVVVAAGAACARTTGSAGSDVAIATGDELVQQARTFMDAYGRDLRSGDRAAIAARYDRSGAYFLGNGRKEWVSYDSIEAQYRGPGWSPPAAFEWRDLSIESVGPDAVVVAGQFLWTRMAGMAPMTFSYTGLLRRRDGELRIRLEDESLDPRSLPAPPAPGGPAGQ